MIGGGRLAAEVDHRDEHTHCLKTIHDLPAFRNKLCPSIAFFVLSQATKLCSTVGASLLAMDPQAPRLTGKYAPSFTTIVGTPPGASSLLQGTTTAIGIRSNR
ncbi:hypothetical protein EMIT0196MI5_20261 [Pseudomonas sp. IT-196MI5]